MKACYDFTYVHHMTRGKRMEGSNTQMRTMNYSGKVMHDFPQTPQFLSEYKCIIPFSPHLLVRKGSFQSSYDKWGSGGPSSLARFVPNLTVALALPSTLPSLPHNLSTLCHAYLGQEITFISLSLSFFVYTAIMAKGLHLQLS